MFNIKFCLFILTINLCNGKLPPSSRFDNCENVYRAYKAGLEAYQIEDDYTNYLVKEKFTVRPDDLFPFFFASGEPSSELAKKLQLAKKSLYGSLYILNSYFDEGTPTTEKERSAFLKYVSRCIPKSERCLERPAPACDVKYPYRSIDGTCNNLFDPLLGSPQQPFRSLFGRNYDDGISKVRKSVADGSELTSARTIVNTLFIDPEDDSKNMIYEVNMACINFFQWIVHDIIRATNQQPTEPGNEVINCCAADYSEPLPYEYQSDMCLPYSIPDDDVFFHNSSIRSLNFIRSASMPNDCLLGPMKHMNTVTFWIDGSALYGSDDLTAKKLRLMSGGKMLASELNGLPEENGRPMAGDNRAVQHPGLLIDHWITLRLHNYIVAILAKLNQHWNDEKLYQETRKIVVAIIQNIAHGEMADAVLYGFPSKKPYKRSLYHPKMDGTPSNDAVHAMRYLHSKEPERVLYANFDGSENKSVLLTKTLNNANQFLKDNYYQVLMGTIYQKANTGGFTNEVRNGLGAMMVDTDLNRERDHGVDPYVTYVHYCHGLKVEKFYDLLPLIPEDNIKKLKRVYKSVKDVDFYAGGSLEEENGLTVGPTFRCIIKKFFEELTASDRFFYSHYGWFTDTQLAAIMKITFAIVMCLTSDNPYLSVPEYVCYVPGLANPSKLCSFYKFPTFIEWKEVPDGKVYQ